MIVTVIIEGNKVPNDTETFAGTLSGILILSRSMLDSLLKISTDTIEINIPKTATSDP